MTKPDFHETLRQRFVEFTPHSGECGMRITELSATQAIVVLPYREDWLGDTERQLIHPGIVTTLVDSACGAAVLGALLRLEPIATIDLRMDYLRAARPRLDLICRAECHRLTSSVAFARASVWQQNADEPVAIAQGAFMRSGARAKPAGAKA